MVAQATSIAARVSISTSTAKRMRGRVFQCILDRGSFGATLAEVVELTGISLQTVCARRNELGKKYLVVDSGLRRPTPSGRTAIVWVVDQVTRSALQARETERRSASALDVR